MPGTHASTDELVAIAKAVASNGGGLMQNVLNLSGDFDGEMDLIRTLAETTGDRVLFSKYSGTEITIEGEEHLIIREDDVLGVCE